MSALAGAFHFSIWHISTPNLGGNAPQQEESEADKGLGPVFPALSPPGSLLVEKEALAGTEAFLWCAPGLSTTMADSHLVSGSSTASLRLSVLFPLTLLGKLAISKRSEMTLILCFQKAHRQNVDPYGFTDSSIPAALTPQTQQRMVCKQKALAPSSPGASPCLWP